jgi:hypothetical protein
MFTQYQSLGVILTILQILLAPLAIGLVLALATGTARRAIIAAAISAAAMVFVGVALIDAITRLRGPLGYINAVEVYSRPGSLAVSLCELILSVGLSLNFAAVVLGLRETARLRRWGWFWAFLATQIAAALGTTLFYLTYAGYFISQSVIEHLYRGDPTVSAPYYLLTSLLMIATPLATLLFAITGVPRAEPAQSMAPATPNQPYTPYPPYR